MRFVPELKLRKNCKLVISFPEKSLETYSSYVTSTHVPAVLTKCSAGSDIFLNRSHSSSPYMTGSDP